MENVFKNASWIWYEKNEKKDSYGDFKDTFNFSGEETFINISCDGDYTLFINGHFVASNQYGDFEHYKIYDTINITEYLNFGKNTLDITVWYIGIASSRYRPYRAGLLYEIKSGNKTLCKSDENTLCRENPNYKSGYGKMISVQLGQSFLYDATKPETEYHKSFIAHKKFMLFSRPIQKLQLLKEKETTYLKSEGNHYLIDLGEETVGLPTLHFLSETEQKITVFWGEHIIDGGVRGKIGGRNFSYEYIAKSGENQYTNYMLRLGCRYLEVFSEQPIEIKYVGLIPQIYPVEVLPKKFKEPLKQQIYDACVNTLKLCIMEHYVDTPWREQSFYVYDSRNQIACGYKAFKDGNKDYVRACLRLISQDDRKDGLLSITYPSGGTLAIPSFSLHFFTAIREYLDFTNDLAFIDEIYDKLFGIIKAFEKQINNGILYSFKDKDYWNFYDWSDYMVEDIGLTETKPDFMINVLFIYALKNFKIICEKAGKPFPFDETKNLLKKNIKEAFFDKENGLFSMSAGGKEFTELGNSLAILSELSDLKETRFIAEKLASGSLLNASLSMKCFKYDALLKVNKKYHDVILKEICDTYKPMLDSGATTVFEVSEGASAFGNSGSLCHGWSAIPILYL